MTGTLHRTPVSPVALPEAGVLEMAQDHTVAPASEYLALTQVYPPKDPGEIAVRRGSRGQEPGSMPLYQTFLDVVDAYNASAAPDLRADGTAGSYQPAVRFSTARLAV
jgi:hypothetical protein